MLMIDWSTQALDDVDSVVDYLFARNPAAAMEMDFLIHESVRNLAVMPYIGRPGRLPETRELVIHPNYIIVYEVNAQMLKILSLIHTRQSYP